MSDVFVYPAICLISACVGGYIGARKGSSMFVWFMVSGILRGIEKFATQAAWNNPDLIWITLRGLVNWTCNVFLQCMQCCNWFRR